MVYRSDEGFSRAREDGIYFCPFSSGGCNAFCGLYVNGGCALSELDSLGDTIEELAQSVDDLKNVLQSMKQE